MPLVMGLGLLALGYDTVLRTIAPLDKHNQLWSVLGLMLIAGAFLFSLRRYVADDEVTESIRAIGATVGLQVRTVYLRDTSVRVSASRFGNRDLIVTSAFIDSTTPEEKQFLIARALLDPSALLSVLAICICAVVVPAIGFIAIGYSGLYFQAPAFVWLVAALGVFAMGIGGCVLVEKHQTRRADAEALRYYPDLEVAEQAIAKSVLGVMGGAYDRADYIKKASRIKALREAAGRMQVGSGQ